MPSGFSKDAQLGHKTILLGGRSIAQPAISLPIRALEEALLSDYSFFIAGPFPYC